MPRDFFSHKHPKLLAKVVIYKPHYAIKTNRLDASECYGLTHNKGLFWDVNSKSLKMKRAIKIMIYSFMVRRDFRREEVMLVHGWADTSQPQPPAQAGKTTWSNHQQFAKPGKMLGDRAEGCAG